MLKIIIKRTVVTMLIFTLLTIIGGVKGDWSVEMVLAVLIANFEGLLVWTVIISVIVSVYTYFQQGKKNKEG